jgi:preprotein translocase subunit SecF
MKIDFIGKRRVAFTFSTLFILVGIGWMTMKGGIRYGIDFTGGALLHLRFQREITPEDLGRIRELLNEGGIRGNIQHIGVSRDEILIKTQNTALKGKIDKEIRTLLEDEFKEFEVLRAERVGPVIGRDMQRKAIFAILFALTGMLIYITLRFEFGFALAAIAALFHDILVTVLALCAFGVEFDIPIIAALLTISGYSINDTIVIFDRIRENIRLLRKERYPNLINVSINQNLGRTIITSLTTLFVVSALYLFGGPVIHPFSLALIIGVFVGTYSSIFVASPLLIYWSTRR